MKTCGICSVQFNDGAKCGICKKQLDFGCSNITESGWRKLGAERRAQWKCPDCRPSSPTVPASALEPSVSASLDVILSEIRDIRRQLVNLPTLVDDIKTIKVELSELKTFTEFSSSRLDDFQTKLAELEATVSSTEGLRDSMNAIQTDMAKLQFKLASDDQRSRLNNVEIKGIPVKSNENLFSIMESISREIKYNCPKSAINYISRVPKQNSKEKLIIVSFLNRYIKEDFIAAARAFKDLSTSNLGFQCSPQRIYINDHLTVESKQLLSKVKAIAKERNYTFVWVKYGKIHIRKNTTSKTIIIRNETDLNKII
ncbi:PREDICTED: uncharacterized protein LOC106114452 [Papilio xuthus]|uniref:Uncharacterized protein LOC106114452 n=1 Tax=Papilio xuthus TaxID=66420 RepID=A0AAJ6Z1E7_PAPXU|nr:PREDICTED: uncharacterized protein LOC106114452 [Papilio xuthus]